MTAGSKPWSNPPLTDEQGYGGLSKGIFESELFGDMKGAPVIRDRFGRARVAAGALSSRQKDKPRLIKQHCKLSDESQELIHVAMTELISARALTTGF